jgi:hypothetical protein
LLRNCCPRSAGSWSEHSHEGAFDFARVLGACLQDVVVNCSYEVLGSRIRGLLLFAWSEEGRVLSRLGERVLMLGDDLLDTLCEESGRHLLLGHCHLGHRLETGGADLLRIRSLRDDCWLLGFDDNWLADNGWHSSRKQMGLGQQLLTEKTWIVWLQEHVFRSICFMTNFPRLEQAVRHSINGLHLSRCLGAELLF